jgi:ATP-dependent Lon protease
MNFIIYCLRENYKVYINYIKNIQNHIYTLFKINIILETEKNTQIYKLYEIQDTINKNFEYIYNKHNNNYDIKKDDFYINCLSKMNINNINDANYEKIYDIFKKYILIIDKKSEIYDKYFNYIYPFEYLNSAIRQILNTIGTYSIVEYLKLYDNEYDINLDIQTQSLIKFYNDIFISYNVVMLDNELEILELDNNLIQRNSEFNTKNLILKKIINDKHKKDELLNNNFMLHIKIKNKWCIFYGTFKNDDSLLLNVKSPGIYGKISNNIIQRKKDLILLIKDSESYKQSQIKYLELWEVISMTTNELKIYIDKRYEKYCELNNKPFPLIMKEFTNNVNNVNKNIINCYEIIKLLLIGTDDNVNVAGILFGVLKEKKLSNELSLIADIIYYNLSFLHQVKLKKVQHNLKVGLEKLSELSLESIDLKKQLALNKKIPNYIKALANEKISEMKLNNNDQFKQLTYVKTLLQFPWSCDDDVDIFTELNNNRLDASKFIKNLKERLELITYGHTKAKEQIILQIGQWITNPKSRGNSIALGGPPGVGKTLLAKSLGAVLNIPFVQITLGGQNDGEILHGHGYTY